MYKRICAKNCEEPWKGIRKMNFSRSQLGSHLNCLRISQKQ